MLPAAPGGGRPGSGGHARLGPGQLSSSPPAPFPQSRQRRAAHLTAWKSRPASNWNLSCCSGSVPQPLLILPARARRGPPRPWLIQAPRLRPGVERWEPRRRLKRGICVTVRPRPRRPRVPASPRPRAQGCTCRGRRAVGQDAPKRADGPGPVPGSSGFCHFQGFSVERPKLFAMEKSRVPENIVSNTRIKVRSMKSQCQRLIDP